MFNRLSSAKSSGFVEAKRIACARLRYAGSLAATLPWLQVEIEEIDEVFPD